MRFARYQQNAQVLANAVDDRDRTIVGVGDLAVGAFDRQFHDVAPGARHGDLKRHFRTEDGALQRNLFAVDRHPDVDWVAVLTGPDDAVGHHQRLVDDAETRRVDEMHATVALALVACDQRMQRARQAVEGARHIVHLAVGDHHRAADTRGRHVAEHAFQRRKQPGLGAVVGLARPAGFHHAHVELAEAAEARLQRFHRLVGGGLARADILALAAVDDDGHDALQRVAFLVEQNRIEERERQGGKGGDTQQRAALAQIERGKREQRHRHGKGGHKRPGQERFEGEGPVHQPLLLPEPFEQDRHVHLIRLIVAGQHVHHDVDAGAKRVDALHRIGRHRR